MEPKTSEKQNMNSVLKEIWNANDYDTEIQANIKSFISLNQKRQLSLYLAQCFGQERSQKYFEKLKSSFIEQNLQNILQEIKLKFELQASQLGRIQKQIQQNNLDGLKEQLILLIGIKKSIYYIKKLQKFIKIQTLQTILTEIQINGKLQDQDINTIKYYIVKGQNDLIREQLLNFFDLKNTEYYIKKLQKYMAKTKFDLQLVDTIKTVLYELQSNENIKVTQINQLKQIIQSKKSMKSVKQFLLSLLGRNKFQKYFELLQPFINKQIRKPIPQSKLLRLINDLEIYSYPAPKVLTPQEESMSINLIVLGQTGSGKTTLLNSLINYIMQVELDDNFRYEIIQQTITLDQSVSQTSKVTVYNIKKHENFPPIKIIDTPGFGDTRGIDMDKKIVQMISNLFKSQISTIVGICFVVQASNFRLTINQKYIFNSIMQLFGNDIAENFMFLLTFCDGSQPPILQTLQSNEGFGEIIPKIKEPWYLKFNNSAIFQNNKLESIKMFWKLGMDSFGQLINKLKTLDKKSLTLTKQVLHQRKSLENIVSVLQPKMNKLLNLMDIIRQQISIVERYKHQINASKDFKYSIQQIRIRQIRLPPNIRTTRCMTCNFTCHQDCQITNNKNKAQCCAMGQDGYCNVCQKGCHWKIHKNSKQKVQYYTQIVQKTNKELEEKYYNINDKKSKQQQMIDGLGKLYSNIQLQCLEVQEKIKNSLDKLKKIALKTNTIEDSIQYLELLIQSQLTEQKAGYLQRVQQLNSLKKQHQLINEIYKNENKDFKTINDFKKQFIRKKKIQFKNIVDNFKKALN